METSDHAADDSDCVPEQGAGGWVVDVGFHHGGVGSKFLSESDHGQHHLLINSFQKVDQPSGETDLLLIIISNSKCSRALAGL